MPPKSVLEIAREKAAARRKEVSESLSGEANPPAHTAGPSMAVDPPAPPVPPGTRPAVLSPTEKLLRILSGFHGNEQPLSEDEQTQLFECLRAFLDDLNPLLPLGQRFSVTPRPRDPGAVHPAGRTATITKPVVKPSPPSRAPAKETVPKPAPTPARPSYAEKAKPKTAPPPKNLQQGTKASHLVLRPYIATRDRNSAKAIRDECERLEFVQDETLSITDVVWTMHGDLRITANRPITTEQSHDLIAAVTKYSAKGQVPVVQNRPTVSTLKFTLVPRMTRSGNEATPAKLEGQLRNHPTWKNVELLRPPTFAVKQDFEGPVATIKVEIKDTRSGTIGRRLLHTDVDFFGSIRRCKPWTVKPPSRQCSTCLRWGHIAHDCTSRSARCALCAANHPTSMHRHFCKECEKCTENCLSARCLNCGGLHRATSKLCVYYTTRFVPVKGPQQTEGRPSRVITKPSK
jgi:hypothetical protein